MPPARGRWPDTPGGRRRQRLEDVRRAMPSVYLPSGEESTGRARRAVEGAYARSSVPTEHLTGLSAIRVTDRQDEAGHYYPLDREIHVSGRTADRTDLAGNLIHETGHHRQFTLNAAQFIRDHRSHREALAENYSEQHTRPYGGEKWVSHYDKAVTKNTALVKNDWGAPNPKVLWPTQKQHYRDTRKSGELP